MISRLLERFGVRRGPSALLFFLLVAADGVLVALHVLSVVVGVPSSPYFWIDGDRGYGEFMQYVKMFWAALLLAGIWWKWRQGFWLASGMVVLYLLVDDAMSLHERLRVHVPISVSPDFFVRENHVQELAYLVGVAFVLLVPLALTYRRVHAATRGVARRILELFLTIAFFAIAVDFVHTLYEVTWYFELIAVIEDGGEMVVGSLLVAFLVSVTTVLRGEGWDGHHGAGAVSPSVLGALSGMHDPSRDGETARHPWSAVSQRGPDGHPLRTTATRRCPRSGRALPAR